MSCGWRGCAGAGARFWAARCSQSASTWLPRRAPRRASAAAAAWLPKNLHRTRDIELAHWGHSGVPPGPFTSAVPGNALVRLTFSHSWGSQLPSLVACTALKELAVKSCHHLTELSPLDTLLPQLTRLEVQRCPSLKFLPPLSSCTALVELSIVENDELEALPDVAGCTALEALTWAPAAVEDEDYSEQYDLFTLSPALSALTRLTRLSVKGCKAETIPDLDVFPRLRALSIAQSDLAIAQLLPLTACTELAELEIKKCGAGDFEIWCGADLPPLTALPALRSLCLEDYGLAERFPSLARLTGLTRLCLTDCNLETRHLAPVSGLTALVELEMHWGSSACEVKDLPCLAACSRLQRLKITGNHHMSVLPNLSGCTRLEELQLDQCGVQMLNLASCAQQLKRLCVNYCSLLELPYLAGSTRLEELECFDCPLQLLPDLSGCAALKTVKFSASNLLPGLDEWWKELRSRGVSMASAICGN